MKDLRTDLKLTDFFINAKMFHLFICYLFIFIYEFFKLISVI